MTKQTLPKFVLVGTLLLATALILFGCGTKAQPTSASNQSQAQTASAPVAQTSSATVATSSQTVNQTAPVSSKPVAKPTTPVAKPAPAPKPAATVTPAPAPKAAVVSESPAVSAGESTYGSLCVGCHGANGVGSKAAPALKGTLAAYPTLSALTSFIHAAMPASKPGSLTPTQAANLAAYLFYLNGK
ncbi:MAG: c-type cytochrome [Peptococcaceae bacterium]|nr:c-type cytochrome [Peptococcaceae bacterium]